MLTVIQELAANRTQFSDSFWSLISNMKPSKKKSFSCEIAHEG